MLRRQRPRGQPNEVALHDEIVINEIFYHAPAEQAVDRTLEESVIMPLESTWRYDDQGQVEGTAWRGEAFDDAAWPIGPALLYFESGSLPAPKATEIELGELTYYFRSEFDFDGDPATTILFFNHVIDDGAVFYINGAEVHRYRMPAGAIDATTLASRSTGNANFTREEVPGNPLRRGRNTIAVEVHQSSAGSGDVVFGLEIIAAALIDPGHPFRDSPEAWVELYNRSDAAVDLTDWRIRRGIRFDFAPGTSIPAGGYLVVASDRDFALARHPDVPIVGNFERRLSHRSDIVELRDARGNPADAVATTTTAAGQSLQTAGLEPRASRSACGQRETRVLGGERRGRCDCVARVQLPDGGSASSGADSVARLHHWTSRCG